MFLTSLIIFFSFILCCVFVLPMFYASSFAFLFSFAPVSWFCQYSMPPYFYFFFSFVSVSWFCQCSMPLYLYFSCLLCLWLIFPMFMPLHLYCFLFFFMSDVLVWPMLYSSFLNFFFSFVSVAQFCKCSKPLY